MPLDENLRERSDGSWDAYSTAAPAVDLLIRVSVDAESLSATVPPDEALGDTAEALVLVRGVASRRRDVISQFPLAGTTSVDLRLDKDDYAGRVDLELCIVRRTRRREA